MQLADSRMSGQPVHRILIATMQAGALVLVWHLLGDVAFVLFAIAALQWCRSSGVARIRPRWCVYCDVKIPSEPRPRCSACGGALPGERPRAIEHLMWLRDASAVGLGLGLLGILSWQHHHRVAFEARVLGYALVFFAPVVRGLLLDLAERNLHARVTASGLGSCTVCGYDLTSLPDEHRCPECGTEFRRDRVEATWRFHLAFLRD